jgi:hypothetical protein
LKKRSSELDDNDGISSIVDSDLQTLRGRFKMFKRLKEQADEWTRTPQKCDAEPTNSNDFLNDYEINSKPKRELKIEIRQKFVSEAIIEIHEDGIVNLSESAANEIRVCCANLDTDTKLAN